MSASDAKLERNPSSEPSPKRITEMAWGFAPPLILEAAVRHKVFDLLDTSPKTHDELDAPSVSPLVPANKPPSRSQYCPGRAE